MIQGQVDETYIKVRNAPPLAKGFTSCVGADFLSFASRFDCLPHLPDVGAIAALREGVVSPLGIFFMSRSSFFVGFGSSRFSVPFRRVVGLALSGGCCSWSLRPSSRSLFGKTYQINNLTQQQQQ